MASGSFLLVEAGIVKVTILYSIDRVRNHEVALTTAITIRDPIIAK
jgi:hypothetical protein